MTDTKYVTVPREPTQAQLDAMLAAAEALLISPTKKSMGSKESAHEMNAATYRAALTAAPPAASVRVRGLVWECLHETYWRAKPLAGLPAPYFAAQTSEGAKIAALAPNEHLGMFDDVDAAKAACEAHWQAYVRTLLAPAVDERAASSEPEMCPNCVTPWKCNGPHEFPQAASSEAAVAFDAERFERAPCYLCGYNGRGYYQPETHPCAAKYHAHPAPTTADAGVTEAQCYGWVVEWHAQGLVERHLYRTRDFAEGFANVLLALPSTQTDRHVRVVPVIEAALGAREGK